MTNQHFFMPSIGWPPCILLVLVPNNIYLPNVFNYGSVKYLKLLTMEIHINTCSTNIPNDKNAIPVRDISKRSAIPNPWSTCSTEYSSFSSFTWEGGWYTGGGGGIEYSYPPPEKSIKVLADPANLVWLQHHLPD